MLRPPPNHALELKRLRQFRDRCRQDELFELGDPSRDARADGAERDLENVRDFLIRRVVQVEQGQRRQARRIRPDETSSLFAPFDCVDCARFLPPGNQRAFDTVRPKVEM
jgi:hypothetical protein